MLFQESASHGQAPLCSRKNKAIFTQLTSRMNYCKDFDYSSHEKASIKGKLNERIPDPGMALSIENKSKEAKAPKMMPKAKKTDAKMTMVK